MGMKQNAQMISDLTKSAADAMRTAEDALKGALTYAEKDYDHAADNIATVLAGLRLFTSTVYGEHHKWAEYAQHRSEMPVRGWVEGGG